MTSVPMVHYFYGLPVPAFLYEHRLSLGFLESHCHRSDHAYEQAFPARNYRSWRPRFPVVRFPSGFLVELTYNPQCASMIDSYKLVMHAINNGNFTITNTLFYISYTMSNILNVV